MSTGENLDLTEEKEREKNENKKLTSPPSLPPPSYYDPLNTKRTGVGTTGFVLALAWVSAVNAGHTKKTTVNAIFLIGYCLGNLCAPQMWKAEYSPRNTVVSLSSLLRKPSGETPGDASRRPFRQPSADAIPFFSLGPLFSPVTSLAQS